MFWLVIFLFKVQVFFSSNWNTKNRLTSYKNIKEGHIVYKRELILLVYVKFKETGKKGITTEVTWELMTNFNFVTSGRPAGITLSSQKIDIKQKVLSYFE